MFEIHGTVRYQPKELIGVGEGMNSSVYRAFDPYLQRQLAVKEVKKSNLGNDFDSYCGEARAMFAVAHPNIVGLEYICETPEHIALALPYFAAGSLKSRINPNPLGLMQFMKMAQGVLAGVERIHVAGFLHLDLKPANVLFDDTDKPLIADFGQSRLLSSHGTVTYPAMYKWAMPPEVMTTHVAVVQSDIYQLGLLFYRSVNGDRVYELQKSMISSDAALQNRIVRGKFPDPGIFLPHVPKRVRSVIRKALRTQPSERYRSASEMAAALGSVQLALNWSTESTGDGAYIWRAVRPGKANCEVELCKTGSSWETRLWTVNHHERRRSRVAEVWRRGLSYRDACKHLTAAFADLGRQA